MNTVFVRIAEAIRLQLVSALGSSINVFRDRVPPIGRNLPSAIVIKLDKTQGERGGTFGSPTDWGTVYVIECYARCDADSLPTEAVDPVVKAAFEALSTVGPELGLDVEDILPDPRIEWDLGGDDTPLVCAIFTVRVVHRTQATVLEPWS